LSLGGQKGKIDGLINWGENNSDSGDKRAYYVNGTNVKKSDLTEADDGDDR